MKIYILAILLVFNVCIFSGIGWKPCWKEQSRAAQSSGFRLLSDGSQKEAILQFRRALQDDPYLLHANLLLGELLLSTEGEVCAAEPYLSRYGDLRGSGDTILQADLLEKIVAGEVEEPIFALKAILWAIRNDFSLLLAHRIDGRCSEAEIRLLKKFSSHSFRLVRLSLRNDSVIMTVLFLAESKPIRFYLWLNPSGTWSLVNAMAV